MLQNILFISLMKCQITSKVLASFGAPCSTH